jgi:hypothetical protein
MARFRHYVCRCTAFGTSYSTQEEWSTGFYMGLADADTPDPTQASADAFLTHWQTFFTHANVDISSGFKTVGVRVQKLNKDDGKVLPAYNFYAYPTVPFAGADTGIPAPQISLVASLQARPDAGLASKGRMFLPGVVKNVQADGHITTANATDVLTPLAAMFNAINDDANIPGRLINASRGRGLQLFGDAPVNRYVQDVLIGNVYDTQRRRRNQLQETYVSSEIFLD